MNIYASPGAETTPAFTLKDTFFIYKDVSPLRPGDPINVAGEFNDSLWVKFQLGPDAFLFGKLNATRNDQSKSFAPVLFKGTGIWEKEGM